MKFFIYVLSVFFLIAMVRPEPETNGLRALFKKDEKVAAPWWCNAAVTKCDGGEDPCCYGFWANPKDACKAACAQCGRSC